MAEPTNKALYERAKKEIDKIYGTKTSAYRSMAIVKKYKEMGGTYSGNKSTSGTSQWLKEKWVKVNDYINGKSVPCGYNDRNKHACRPSLRINSKTPITIQEVLKKHGKAKTLELAKAKQKDASKTRVNWVDGKII
jgi:hypothetical protein